jgi:2-aminoadipate transaminase
MAILRQALLDHLAGLDGIAVEQLGYGASDILITNGSQQGLYLAAESLFDPGDIVLCEAPSYFVYTTALQGFGVRCVGIPMDEQGMRVDALEETLRTLRDRGELGRVKAIYTVDYYQNPTGLTLSAERRVAMLELARRFSESHRILILEDAAYRELYYDAADLPPASIKSMDDDNAFVGYFGTFSKPYAPG